MACGENARRIYSQTRMDEALNFRALFDKARTLKDKQDAFCDKALRDNGRSLQEDVIFPDDLALEAVVDVLRGKVKVNTHCYTLEDFSSFVSHTNEYKFPLAAFHHSHEAYLVPELLKKVYGAPPAVALFSVNANYKTEAYFGSPFAAAILSANNITTISKSDHPVTDSRRLMKQVAESHHYGLSAGKALRGVTSSAARVLGLDHRIGQAKVGLDADLVLWNKHPLALGAKPLEVIIDGTRQQLKVKDNSYAALDNQVEAYRKAPSSANYSSEIKRVANSGPEIIAWESTGFPVAKRRVSSVRLFNVSRVYSIEGEKGDMKITSTRIQQHESVLLSGGRVACVGDKSVCQEAGSVEKHIDLKGGTVIPGLIAFGSSLGLTDIVAEPATKDGSVDALISSNTARAVDGLRLGGNDLRFAHSSGICSIVSAPESRTGIKQGISTHVDTGVEELFEEGAIRKSEVALHMTIDHWQAGSPTQPTLGQQVASIRSAVKKATESLDKVRGSSEQDDAENEDVWKRVASGSLPLIVNAKQAETLAQLIFIKEAFPAIKLILSSADEASFASLPARLKKADIPVLVRPFEWAKTYDSRRAVKLGGVQASQSKVPTSLLGVLLKHGVKTGFMIEENYQAVTLLWDTIAAGQEAGISHEQSLELASTR
jgi:imidazolonepropionase-like amidohydrolase